MTGAVMPFERLKKRKQALPTDRVFGKTQRDLFNIILDELNLKKDREGNRRTAYSLRHTYICMRLPVALYVRNDNRAAKLIKLIATCGPLDMDDPQPAITVMMPDED